MSEAAAAPTDTAETDFDYEETAADVSAELENETEAADADPSLEKNTWWLPLYAGYNLLVKTWQKWVSSAFCRRLLNWPPVYFVRSSLTIRITAVTAVAVMVMMVILSVFVETSVRDGLFEKRLTQVVGDATIRFQNVQNNFDESEVESEHEVREMAYTFMQRQRDAAAGVGAVGIMLLPNPKEHKTVAINAVTDETLTVKLSKEIRQKVETESGIYWQSAELKFTSENGKTPTGKTVPGIVVGTTIQIPIVGSYEMYLVYSLQHEKENINLISKVLILGTVLLLIILIVMLLALTHSTLRPVRRTAAAAQELSEGKLGVRVPVQGVDELAKLGDSFNEMAASLETQLQNYQQLALLQQRFVSDVSHELRTPLASIRIASDLIYDSQEILPKQFHRTASILHREVDRFDNLLADLIEISRIDASTAQLNPSLVSVRGLVDHVVEAAAPLAHKLGVQIVVRSWLAAESKMEVDRVRVQRIIRNLLTNAVEYAEGKPVFVNLAETESCLAIQVVDHGIGMTDQVAQRVFDRFYRADPSRQRTTGGTGLGLAISAEDAALHDGLLTVLSCPHWGSAFLLLLPRTRGGEILDIPPEVEISELNQARREWALHHPEDIILPESLSEEENLQAWEVSEVKSGVVSKETNTELSAVEADAQSPVEVTSAVEVRTVEAPAVEAPAEEAVAAAGAEKPVAILDPGSREIVGEMGTNNVN